MPRNLRADLVSAAASLLEREGTVGAVSLRGVAREAGVSAPAVYGHFADLDALMDAVLDEGFVALLAATRSAAAGVEDPVDRLVAGCQAYVEQGTAAPARYGAMFAGRHLPHAGEAFDGLVGAVQACVSAGRSASRDPRADAGLVWTALHGLVTLRVASPGMGWPDLEAQLTALVERLALLTPEIS
ncbi:TetR/AcrR family transcriptional regulator [Blastococcus sp. LR1]|uniref:TetR/AcrR family transcriptional regulator n=1 Tax=Blastococcus sp. LR1 TaxID=2877000 RepID=UPI001CC931D9|nr:TetR/AcrR family transcriptional regulator [Blastococcus sp. LR1]MCA0144981.1 TetR/AcrR family transcriptional regulator [Blastococcus sp. LR1]